MNNNTRKLLKDVRRRTRKNIQHMKSFGYFEGLCGEHGDSVNNSNINEIRLYC